MNKLIKKCEELFRITPELYYYCLSVTRKFAALIYQPKAWKKAYPNHELLQENELNTMIKRESLAT
jgi:hypothetical protein